MMNNSQISSPLEGAYRRIHGDERGAMAMLALAAIVVIVMVGMVLYDAADLGTEKTHLQTATDASAYSQATVQAQSMNMMAFTNVGKRMTVGMVNSYISMVQWMRWIGQMSTLLEYFAYALYLVPKLQDVADQLRRASRVGGVLQRQEEFVREGAVTSRSSKCHFEVWTCWGNGEDLRCGWQCQRDYDDSPTEFWEWAAPNTDWPLVPPMWIGCGQWAEQQGPLSCAGDDIFNWHPGPLVENYYGRDLLGYDNYQRYLLSVAPYWAWTEGVTRGLVNAAPVTVGYPMPQFDRRQAETAGLPVERGTFQHTCERADEMDRGFGEPMGLDFLARNMLGGIEGAMESEDLRSGAAGHAGEAVALIIAGAMTFLFDPPDDPAFGQFFPRPWQQACEDVTRSIFDDASGGWGGAGEVDGFAGHGEPYLLRDYDAGQHHRWLMDTSNLMFGYRPNARRMDQGRQRYFAGPDHAWGDAAGQFGGAGGAWALARGEMAFQDGRPHGWSPAWGARLRPVALPGEWSRYDIELADAFEELAGDFAASPLGQITATAHQLDDRHELISHPHDNFGRDINEEFGAVRSAVEGFDADSMEGLAR